MYVCGQWNPTNKLVSSMFSIDSDKHFFWLYRFWDSRDFLPSPLKCLYLTNVRKNIHRFHTDTLNMFIDEKIYSFTQYIEVFGHTLEGGDY